MMWLADNWVLLVIMVAGVVSAGSIVIQFRNKPTSEQINAVKQWLLYAVTEAEKELGSGTGKLKLRQVYDAFITKFPWLAPCVPFTAFSIWVDEVLIDMRRLLDNNNDIQAYVKQVEENK